MTMPAPGICARAGGFEADGGVVACLPKPTPVGGNGGVHMTFPSDEGADLGNLGSVSPPLMSFGGAPAV